MKGKAFHRRVRDADIGPGGFECPCCAPPKCKRKTYMRYVRRRIDILLFKIERVEAQDE